MSNEYFALDANVAALAQAFGEDMGDVKRRILKDATTFPTRVEMVAALPSLADSPDGRIVFANGEGYMRDRNASDIIDMPGWKRWEPIPGVVNASDIVSYGEQSPNPAKQAQARQNLGLGTASVRDESYFATAEQGERADAAVSYNEQSLDPSEQEQARDNIGLGSASVRDESYFATAEQVEDKVIYVPTIADLTALNTSTLPDGQQVSVAAYHESVPPHADKGGGMFVLGEWGAADGGVVLGNGRNWKRVLDDPSTVRAEWFGARGESTGGGSGSADGAFDDTPALQAALAYFEGIDGGCTLELSAASYKVTDTLRLSGRNGPVHVKGKGISQTYIHPTPFGATKGLFYMDPDESGSNCVVEGLEIRRNVRNKQHPIAIYSPMVGRLAIRDVHIAGLGNTAIWANRLFNDEWKKINIFSCGHRPLEFEVPSDLRLTITSGSPIITADAAFFDAAHVGRTVYVQQTLVSGAPANSAMVAVISAVNSPTEAVLDRDCYDSGSGRTISFDVVKATFASGSSSITLNADCLDADDVGRWIYLDGAASDEGILIAKIASVTSGTEAVLDRNAGRSGTGPAHFTPSVVLGSDEFGASPALNDHVIDDLLVETPTGLGVLTLGGLHLYMNNYKYHGRTYSNNNFWSGQALHVNNTTKVVVKTVEWEFGQHGLSGGPLVLSGASGSVDISGITLNANTHGAYFADYRISGTTECGLAIGAIIADSRLWEKDAGLVNTSAVNPRQHSIYSYAPVVGYNPGGEKDVLLGQQIGSWRSAVLRIGDDAFDTVRPPEFAVRNGCMVDIIAQDFQADGRLKIRTFPSEGSSLRASGSDFERGTGALTGTTGTDGKLTASFADGLLYVENRLGGARTIKVCFTG